MTAMGEEVKGLRRMEERRLGGLEYSQLLI